MLKGKIARRPHWLITKHDTSKMEVFTIDLGEEGEALAVFSFEEEAEMFLDLRLATSGEGWKVRQTSVGELVSVLYGPCSDAKKVALDPVPEVDRQKVADPLSMDRNDFLQVLLGEVPSTLCPVPSRTPMPHKRVEHGHVA